MIERCENPKNSKFHRYGGRGIRVCDEWRHSFEAFYAHIGQRPSLKHSIDRIDNDRGYEPGNVRWATQREQMRNMCRNHRVEAFGESLTIAEWSVRTGIPAGTIRCRMRRDGLSPEEALTAQRYEPRARRRGLVTNLGRTAAND